ncbi:MAG TPA: DUF2470 domain-containing protein [Bryobacteraceae bacterium]|nr:DUF2470 domain-containing protein [Bryobacteraceae bacterium]
MEPSRQHAAPSPSGRPAVPEPSLPERARTLVHVAGVGALSTHSRKQPGFPFGSVMPYAAGRDGQPAFLISSMAMHTQNLKSDARASLLVMQEGQDDPLGAARITLVGEVLPVAEAESAAVRELYLSRHRNAAYWVDFDDFTFYRMQLRDVYFIGGFGVMGWVSTEEYTRSRPDPLAEAAAGILRHMNDDHGEALLLLAQAAGETDAQTAVMTAVDRLGFHVRLRAGDRVFGARIAFSREVSDSEQVRAVLIEMVHAARGARQ